MKQIFKQDTAKYVKNVFLRFTGCANCLALDVILLAVFKLTGKKCLERGYNFRGWGSNCPVRGRKGKTGHPEW